MSVYLSYMWLIIPLLVPTTVIMFGTNKKQQKQDQQTAKSVDAYLVSTMPYMKKLHT